MSSLRKNPGAARAAFLFCWAGLAGWAALVCGAGIVCLAGCNSQPPEVKITSVTKPPASQLPPLPHAASPMPSYPILLEDLPRYEAGLPVPPARSRLSSPAQRDLDSPPSAPAHPAPPLARGTPAAAAPVPAAKASPPPVAKSAAPKAPTVSGAQYVP